MIQGQGYPQNRRPGVDFGAFRKSPYFGTFWGFCQKVSFFDFFGQICQIWVKVRKIFDKVHIDKPIDSIGYVRPRRSFFPQSSVSGYVKKINYIIHLFLFFIINLHGVYCRGLVEKVVVSNYFLSIILYDFYSIWPFVFHSISCMYTFN